MLYDIFVNQFSPVYTKKTKRRDKQKKVKCSTRPPIDRRRDKKKTPKWSTRPPIDRVFAQELESCDSVQFVFWGRLQTQTHVVDKLTTCWMDENHMGVEFREKLKREPGVLFKLPVEAKHLTIRLHSKCCHEFDDHSNPMTILAHSALDLVPCSVPSLSKTSGVKRRRALNQPQHYRTPCDHLAPSQKINHTQQRTVTDARTNVIKESKHQHPVNLSSRFRPAPHVTVCALYALLNAVANMGLYVHENKLLKYFQHQHSVSLKQCVRYFNTLGGFSHHVKKTDEYHPYYNNDPIKLVLVRICAVSVKSADHFHDEKLQRDSHTIAIFNNFIFDSLMTQPIKLSINNLHRCCLGGRDWVFHHTSEAHIFTPEPLTLITQANCLSTTHTVV